MNKLLITGFPPFTPITRLLGNPSQYQGETLASKYAAETDFLLLPVDASSEHVFKKQLSLLDPMSVMMLGGSMDFNSQVTLELEGATNKCFGLIKDAVLVSQAAHDLQQSCISAGISVGTSPPGPLIYWCLKTYYYALEWAREKGRPVVFLHLNYAPLLANKVSQAALLEQFYIKYSEYGKIHARRSIG